MLATSGCGDHRAEDAFPDLSEFGDTPYGQRVHTLIGVLYALGTRVVTVATGPAHVANAANSQSADLAFTLAAPHVPRWIVR